MIHWLKFGGYRVSLKSEAKQWLNLGEYLQKYPDSKATVFIKTTGDIFEKAVKLECGQNYQELDLDCNSMFDGSIRRLYSKPGNIKPSNKPVGDFIGHYTQYIQG